MENNNNSRPVVKFSSSQTRITLYEEEIDRRSLIWYNAADLKQFRDDRKTDVSKIKNQEHSESGTEKLCWWGLERHVVPSVRSMTMQAKKQVKMAVLSKQDKACLDEKCKSASEWAAKVAHKKATYYSSQI
jgi:hypothetical protein